MNGPETGEYPNRPETLTTGQPAIKTYRNLTPDEVALMNAIKDAEAGFVALFERVQRHLHQQNATAQRKDTPEDAMRIDMAQPARWVAMARTDFQVAFMKLTRAVAQPNSPL